MPEERGLQATLRFWDLVFIVVGTVIGSGIFLVPGSVLRETGGHAGLALTVWTVGGLLSLLGALTYAELGGLFPNAGGLYVYLREAFGSLPAFLFGWTMFLAIASGSIATLAVAASGYLGQLVALGPAGQKVAALVIIAAITWVNVRGTRHGAGVQNAAAAIKVGAILLLSILLFAGPAPSVTTPPPSAWPVALTLPLLQGAGVAMIGVLWAYEGWQYVTFSAGETIDPQRTFPRALVLGTAALVGIYLLANVAYLKALGPTGVAGSDQVAADAVRALYGSLAAKALAVPIIISMVGAANGLALTAPRAYYAMARDGVFFRRLAEVHPRFGTPALAILTSSAWAMVLATSGTFQQLFTYVVFAVWIFHALAAVSVFILRRKMPGAARSFYVPGYPWTPIAFLLCAAAIIVNTLVSRPRESLLGLAIVLLGAPVFYVWRRRRVP